MPHITVNYSKKANFVRLRVADLMILTCAIEQLPRFSGDFLAHRLPTEFHRQLRLLAASRLYALIETVDGGKCIDLATDEIAITLNADERAFLAEALESFRGPAQNAQIRVISGDGDSHPAEYYEAAGHKLDQRFDEIIAKLRGFGEEDLE